MRESNDASAALLDIGKAGHFANHRTPSLHFAPKIRRVNVSRRNSILDTKQVIDSLVQPLPEMSFHLSCGGETRSKMPAVSKIPFTSMQLQLAEPLTIRTIVNLSHWLLVLVGIVRLSMEGASSNGTPCVQRCEGVQPFHGRLGQSSWIHLPTCELSKQRQSCLAKLQLRQLHSTRPNLTHGSKRKSFPIEKNFIFQ